MTGILRVGMNLHGWSHLRAAGGNWFGRFFDLDEANPAVAGYF